MSDTSMMSPLVMQLAGGGAGGALYCVYRGAELGSGLLMCAAIGAASGYAIGMVRTASGLALPDPSNMLYAAGYGFGGSYLLSMFM